MSAKPNKELVVNVPNKVPNWKEKWFFVEGDTYEFESYIPTEDRNPMVPHSWDIYNEAITMRATQARFNDKVKVVLGIHKRDPYL